MNESMSEHTSCSCFTNASFSRGNSDHLTRCGAKEAKLCYPAAHASYSTQIHSIAQIFLYFLSYFQKNLYLTDCRYWYRHGFQKHKIKHEQWLDFTIGEVIGLINSDRILDTAVRI